MAKIRLTQRRTMLSDTRKKNADAVSAAILPIFQKQFKHIQKTVIRTGGPLRRKMGKMKVPDGNIGQDEFYRAAALLKVDPQPPLQPAPPPQAQPDTSWDTFKAALVAALLLSLGNAADDIGGVEDEVWQSRGYGQLQFDPDQVVQAYQNRIGRQITNIPDDTLAGVQAAIAAWYTGDAPFSDLIDDLGKYFDENRAKTIANTEVGDLTSQITLEAMKFYGFTDWTWDAMGENPCVKDLEVDGITYGGCADLNGKKFKAGASMPPDASHPNCECQATPIEPDKNE